MSVLYTYEDTFKDDFAFDVVIRHAGYFPDIMHSHEHLQICYVLRGSCIHEITNQRLPLKKGDIFSVPPLVEHRLVLTECKDISIAELDFMPFFINENLKGSGSMESFVDFAYIQPFVTMEADAMSGFNISFRSQLLIESLISNIRTEFQNREEGYRLSIKADLMKLLVTVGRGFKGYLEEKKDESLVRRSCRDFHTAFEYIDTHYDEDFSLEYVAKKANMAPSYFSRIFKMIKGQTFTEYLNTLRVNSAINLLRDFDKSITEICFAVGFNTVSNFNKTFRSHTGLTPSAYRRLIR